MRLKLTQKTLDKNRSHAASSKKATYLWDTELAGFGAYVTATGDVSFLVQKWAGGRGGKAIRYVIGKTKNGMTLDEARTLAKTHIGDIAKGANPIDIRRQARRETRDRLNGMKVSEALDLFIPDPDSDPRKNSLPSRYKTEAKSAMKQAFEAEGLLKSAVTEIAKADIRKMLTRKSDRPAAARNLFAALRPFFRYCVEQEIITVSPMAEMSSPSPVSSRDRLLSSDEIKAFWKATGELSDTWRRFYRLLLLTGQRREEVAGIRWEEIDLDQKTWTIPAERAKNGKAHVVHLSDEAMSELPKAPEGKGTGYVLPGARGESHISGYSKMKRALDDEMKKHLADNFSPWRIHDLRRTMASGLAEMGFPTDVADRLLNHVSGSRSGIKGVYQRYEFLKERKEAIEAWAERVREIVSDKVENPEAEAA
ncbi:tyrosine-type recombinase/integrase [Chelativorans sp. AA-79]|uniref:tyrosine-type recombinase/integrase n=1 Tax=Chelativorans sp. AA-79 TaxID=3028735 RepID=UPI0023F88CE8|nr:tyrosine-type recombinase/integrase [Chelativorans sp. AA-79]WEX07285.1 tyrosine-type recombinase/integrase [Chelativorans sp. AA-79]